MADALSDRIAERLKTLNITARAASLKVSDNPDLLRGIMRAGRRANPKHETIMLLARALEVPPEWFHDAEAEPLPAPVSAPRRAQRRRDIPVRGTVQGSLAYDQRGFQLGTPIAFIDRPAALEQMTGLYAVYVANDSMAPMHSPGELRIVQEGRPPAPGQSVIVHTRHHERDPGQQYIKTFIGYDGQNVVLGQLNPRAEIRIASQYVVAIDRVLTLNEIFGV